MEGKLERARRGGKRGQMRERSLRMRDQKEESITVMEG